MKKRLLIFLALACLLMTASASALAADEVFTSTFTHKTGFTGTSRSYKYKHLSFSALNVQVSSIPSGYVAKGTPTYDVKPTGLSTVSDWPVPRTAMYNYKWKNAGSGNYAFTFTMRGNTYGSGSTTAGTRTIWGDCRMGSTDTI